MADWKMSTGLYMPGAAKLFFRQSRTKRHPQCEVDANQFGKHQMEVMTNEIQITEIADFA
jgi:hypothetical protein